MPKTKISVRGSHAITMAPERGVVHAAIRLEGADPVSVLAAVQRQLAGVRASVEALHDERHGPVTWYAFDQVSTSSHRPWNQDGKQLPLVHVAWGTINVKFSDVDVIGRWLSSGAEFDGFETHGVDWMLTETTRVRLERQAREGAAKQAVRNAQDYADALGLGPVTVVRVSDASSTSEFAMADLRTTVAMDAGAAVPSVNLTPKHVEIAAAVDLTCVVQQRV